MPARPARLTLVFATWCPHCVPISTENARRLAGKLRVPLRELDIDRPDEERVADELVRDHGDWSEDYLIPQVFLERTDGRVTHLLTGVPGPVSGTAARWAQLLSSDDFGQAPIRGRDAAPPERSTTGSPA